MQELFLGGQCAHTGGALLSQNLGSLLRSIVVLAGASPVSAAVLAAVLPGSRGRHSRVRISGTGPLVLK